MKPLIVGVMLLSMCARAHAASIISAYWWEEGQTVVEGTLCHARAEVSGFAEGTRFYFDIYENDLIADEYVTTMSGMVKMDGGKYYVGADWTSVWQDDGVGDPEFAFYVYNSGEQYSKWSRSDVIVKRATHTVDVIVNPGGAVSPSSRSVLSRDTTTFTVYPSTGYSRGSVSGDASGGTWSGNTYTTAPVTQNRTLTFSFVRNVYSVTAVANTGGTVSPASRSVEHGNTTTFTVYPATNYVRGPVSGDASGGAWSGNTYTTAPVTQNRNLTFGFDGKPDLIVRKITLSANSLNTGQSISIDSYVKNQGAATANRGTVKYYLGRNSTDTSYKYIGYGYVPNIGNLGAGSEEGDSIGYTIPSDVTPGTYYVVVMADADNNEPNESYENNNVNSASLTIMPPPSGSIQATLNNWNGSPASGASTKFIRYNGGTPIPLVGSNPDTFTGVPVGNHWVEGYQNNTAFNEYEYWGSVEATVAINATAPAVVNRHTPYCEKFWFEYNGVETNKVPPGSTVVAKATIRNGDTSVSSRTIRLNAWWRYGTSGSGTAIPAVTTTIGPNTSKTVTLGNVVLSSTENDVYAYIKTYAVFSDPNKPALTDAWDWTKKFTATTGNQPAIGSITVKEYDPQNTTGAAATTLLPGKRYVIDAEFTDANTRSDLQFCAVQIKNPSDSRLIHLGYSLADNRKSVQDGNGNGKNDGGQSVPVQDDYVCLTHVEKTEIPYGYRLRFIFWLTARWPEKTDGVDVRGQAVDTAKHVATSDWSGKNLSFKPLSLPSGKWTVIVHGKSNSMDIWPPNTPYLGFGPWAWGNSMTDWFNRQSSPKTGNEWMWEMAEKIRSIDANADVRIHRLGDRLNGTLQTWQGGRTGSYSTTFQPSSTGHNILLYDWDDPSDYVDIDDPDRMHGYAYGAADALWALLGKVGAQDNIHCLIGYSRGGVVVSETSRRVLLAGKGMPHVLLVDAEGWAPYVDKDFHAWKGTRTDQYRSQSGEWTAVLSMWCGGDPLPEADGNDRIVENWPQYSSKSGSIGHGGYPSYLTEWCYLAQDGTKGVLIETPQILRDDLGAQTIKYANTLTPTRPDGLYWGLYNGGFEWLSAAGWTYHGGTTPWTPNLSWLGNDLCSAELDMFASRLVHNWAKSPDNARSVRYWVGSYSLIKDTAQLQQGWYGSGSYRSMDYLQVEDVWWDPVVRTYRFDYGGQVGRVSFDALNLNLGQVLIDDVGFIESAPPTVSTLTGNPNPVVQGANLRLVAGGVIPGDNPISEVRFYRDSNGNGTYDAGTDASFGVAYSGSGGNWEVTQNTTGIPVGQHYFFVLAKDSDGLWSAAVRSASRIEVTQPVNQPPTIGSLSDSPDPVDRGANLTLTASSVEDTNGTVARVDFYHDANNNGVFDEGAGALMGSDTTIVSGQASVTFGTGSLPAGTRRFFAVAYDNQSAASAAVSCRTTIIQKWNLSYQVSPVGSGTIAENPIAGRYADGTQIDPSAAAAATYRFDHWEANGVKMTMPLTMTTNTTIKAVFVYNGGSVVPPILNAIGNQSVKAGSPFSLTVTKQQGDAPITWTLENAPSGMGINSSGVISWSSAMPAGSSHFITVKAANTAGSDAESWMLFVTSEGQVAQPQFSPDGGEHAGGAVSVTITCATAGATIRYTMDGSLPSVTNGQTVASGGTVLVTLPGQLRAKAFKTDWLDSLLKEASYPKLQQAPVTIEGNAMWNRYAYFSWQNINHVYQPDKTNAVIDTWKVDENGNGDPRDDANRILWNGQTDTANGFNFNYPGANSAESGWSAQAYTDADGNGVVVFTRSTDTGSAAAKYTLKPDSGDLYGELTLNCKTGGDFHWGLTQINSVWVMTDPGEMRVYDRAYLNGTEITARTTALNQEPVAGLDYLKAAGVKAGMAAVRSTAKNWTSVFQLLGASRAVDLQAYVQTASRYSGWGFGRHALVTGTAQAGENIVLSAVFRTQLASATKNVALAINGGTATADSEGWYYESHPASLAIDGNSVTSWANSWSMPSWLKVQFNQAYMIDRVAVVWGEGTHNHTFAIALSEDGNTWTNVVPSRASKTDAGYTGGSYHGSTTTVREEFSITPRKARYMRIDVTGSSAPSTHIFKAIVHELEAYPGSNENTPAISLSGDLTFGNVAVGQTATKTLTISNTGNSALTVSSINYPAGFSGAWSGTIAAGGSQAVTVTFSPTAVQSYGGTITVNSDKTAGTNTVACSGAGIGYSLNETFESYTANTWPTGWVADGNGTNLASNRIEQDPVDIANKCLRLTGVNGSYWGALAYHPCTFSADFTVQAKIYNSSETILPNGHNSRGGLHLRQGQYWGNFGRTIIDFMADGTIRGVDGTSLGNYSTDQWIDIVVHCVRTSSEFRQTYWINGALKGEQVVALDAQDANLDNMGLSTGAASAWYDNVQVYEGLPRLQPGSVQLSSATYSVNENGGTVTITAMRTGGSSGAASVSYATANGSATAGSDYTARSGTLTWADGDSANKTFTVPILDDSILEGNETFTVNLSGASGATLGSPSSATVTIVDNEVVTKIIGLSGDLTFGNVAVGQTATKTLTISNTGNSTLTVTSISYPPGFSGAWIGTIVAGGTKVVTVTFSPTAAQAYGGTISVNSDKTAGTNTIACSGTVPVTRIIGLSGDLAFGSCGTNQSAPRMLTISNTGNSTLTVTSIVYPAGFSGAWSGTIAAGGTKAVTVTFSPTAAQAYGGTITVNSDKTAGTNTVACSGTGRIPFTLKTQCEDFNIGGQGVGYSDTTAANLGGKYRLAEGVDIAANAGAGTGYCVGWTAPGEWMEYTVNIPVAGTFTFDTIVAALGTGGQFRILVDGVDKTGVLPIPNTGAWNVYAIVSKYGIALTAGTHTVRLEMVANTTAGAVGAFDWFEIMEEPPNPGTLQLSSTAYSVAETGGTVTITVTRTGGTAGAASVNYATSNGTASAGSDYTTRSGALSWASGDGASKTFTVPILSDTATEGNETFNVTLSSATGATLGSPATAVVTITESSDFTVTMQCEDFNTGGQGVGYSDTTAANLGGKYRTTEGVDIAADAAAGNGYSVGWTVPGEWMQYSVNIPVAGTFTFDTRVAALGSGGQFRILVDGVDKTGALAIPNTGAWNAYATVSKGGIALTAGTHAIRLVMVANTTAGAVGAFDWIRISSQAAPSRQTYPSGTPWAVPGTIECENFDQGGSGVAYSDTTPANQGGKYRTADGVDIAADAKAFNGYCVGWTAPGEWMEYTINVATAGTYTLDTRVAALGTGGKFRVLVDGTDQTGDLPIANTGAWNNYGTASKTGITLGAGRHTVRLVMVSNTTAGAVGAFDRLAFTLTAAGQAPAASGSASVTFDTQTTALRVATSNPAPALQRVTTSDDALAWSPVANLTDGNAATVWEGAPGQKLWWILLDYGQPVWVTDTDLVFATPWTRDLRLRVSRDGQAWSDADPLWTSGAPVQTRYLWFILSTPTDSLPPRVGEIGVEATN